MISLGLNPFDVEVTIFTFFGEECGGHNLNCEGKEWILRRLEIPCQCHIKFGDQFFFFEKEFGDQFVSN